jgi:hypothetical protein
LALGKLEKWVIVLKKSKIALGNAEKLVLLKLVQLQLRRAEKSVTKLAEMALGKWENSVILLKMAQMELGKAEISVLLLKMAKMEIGKFENSAILLKMAKMMLGKAEK